MQAQPRRWRRWQPTSERRLDRWRRVRYPAREVPEVPEVPEVLAWWEVRVAPAGAMRVPRSGQKPPVRRRPTRHPWRHQKHRLQSHLREVQQLRPG
ncbi:hypothetical protein [Mycobacterium kyogaense]|uniref:hypothetical protein n=1 Tax=Mycobacterium kyogaense TaxID=2212479 RepID=UPI0013C43E55|nr:hypothetical protein [Mycobacterium kyogaense]